MNPFEMVLGIVAIVMIARVLRDRYRAQSPVQQVAMPDPDAARLRDEVARLKERVQVLERVITDQHQSADLDRQIAALRDR